MVFSCSGQTDRLTAALLYSRIFYQGIAKFPAARSSLIFYKSPVDFLSYLVHSHLIKLVSNFTTHIIFSSKTRKKLPDAEGKGKK
jgi:hypothetical protein